MHRFTADDLIECYRRGVFPMAEARKDDEIFLVDPARRGVVPLTGFHVPHRLARTVRREPFEVRVDTAFAAVVEACAAPAEGRTETWINGPIERLYAELFARGYCHTVECWRGDEMVGGLYGVSIGAAFFGESMFSTARDASKVALVHLVGRLIVGGYKLLDAQFITEHLTQFGTEEIDRQDYRKRLKAALALESDYFALDQKGGGAEGPAAGAGAAAGGAAALGAGAGGAGAALGAGAGVGAGAGLAGGVAALAGGRAALAAGASRGRGGTTGSPAPGPAVLQAISQAS